MWSEMSKGLLIIPSYTEVPPVTTLGSHLKFIRDVRPAI